MWCCHNEQATIRAKIENTLEACRNYPGLSEILVFVDASNDDTFRILETFGDAVHAIDCKTRSGKSQGMRRSAQLSRGQLLAFTDANTLLAPDACCRRRSVPRSVDRRRIRATVYSNAADTAVTQINGAYWRLEELTKRLRAKPAR